MSLKQQLISLNKDKEIKHNSMKLPKINYFNLFLHNQSMDINNKINSMITKVQKKITYCKGMQSK